MYSTFFWDKPISDLPNEGWDWLIKKGIQDFKNNTQQNCLGGLQIIITRHNQGKGLSQLFIDEGKRIMREKDLKYFVLPIRPTFKHQYPYMPMLEHIKFRKDNKIYDPWIRSHLKSNAKILGICSNSMNVKRDIKFWEQLMNKKITKSGSYEVLGALNPIRIDIDSKVGEYREENIWIYYH